MPEYSYQIEATFENTAVGSDRVDTTIINMEHLDFFIAVNQLVDEFYPAKLIELHLELVTDEEEDEDGK
jgi:hypothetical protein